MNLTETTAASLATATAIAYGATVIPGPLMLPVFSIAAVTVALSLACIAWLRSMPRSSDRITTWDVAGGLLFIGFAAALMSNPESALAMFEQTSEMTTTSLTR